MTIVDKVRERLPKDVLWKLTSSCGVLWYETVYYPFYVLLETICGVFYEEYHNDYVHCGFDECIDIVNEITGLQFLKDDDEWDREEEELQVLFDSMFDMYP